MEEMMGDDGRRWEEMDEEILVSIFLSLDISDLTEGVAHVCGRWRSVCRDPDIWKTINLSMLRSDRTHPSEQDIRKVIKILKISLSLAGQNTHTLIFPFTVPLHDELFIHAAERTPNLKKLALPAFDKVFELTEKAICNAFRGWQKVESLSIPFNILGEWRRNALKEISERCFIRELKIVSNGYFWLDQAEMLFEIFPKLPVLSIPCSAMYEDALDFLLDNFPDLKVLNISHCDLRRAPSGECFRISKEVNQSIFEKASRLEEFFTNIECLDSCTLCLERDDDESIWGTDEVQSFKF